MDCARTPLRRAAVRTCAVATALGALLALAGPVAAVAESDAPTVWAAENGDDALGAAWHVPAIVEAGTPWEAAVRFRAGSNVTAVMFQVCRVGDVCFNPPTPAREHGNGTRTEGNGTWSFRSSDILAGPQPVQFQAGWTIGVRYFVERAAREAAEAPEPGQARETAEARKPADPVVFPRGLADEDPACVADRMACAHTHYLVFRIEGGQESPPAGVAFVAAVLLAAAVFVAAGATNRRKA